MCVNLRRNQAIYAHNIYLGQTNAEVFVKRNIDISSIYTAILYLFQFQNKNGRFPVVYLSMRMRGIRRSRVHEVTHVHLHYSITKDSRFFY